MKTLLQKICFSILLASGIAGLSIHGAYAENVYKWVDDDGVTHYGDSIPPNHSTSQYSILNEQGVEIKVVGGALSSEDRQQLKAQAEAEEKAREEQATAVIRDRVLLSTYLSVDEIEALRDRRVELVRAQIQVTKLYLNNLRSKLERLEQEAQRHSQQNTGPKAQPLDEKLARELADTIDSIMLYDKTLKESEAEQLRLENKFIGDINRFLELKQLPAGR
jgi:hypothetical protein